jgi:hypothetical protein
MYPNAVLDVESRIDRFVPRGDLVVQRSTDRVPSVDIADTARNKRRQVRIFPIPLLPLSLLMARIKEDVCRTHSFPLRPSSLTSAALSPPPSAGDSPPSRSARPFSLRQTRVEVSFVMAD